MKDEFRNFKNYVDNLVSMEDAIFDSAIPMLNYKTIKKGQNFLSKDDRCNEIAFINKGLLKIFYLKDGLEVNTCFCSENSIASSFESFSNQSSSNETIQALEDSELIVITKEKFEKLQTLHPKWQELAQKMVEKECIRLSSRVQALGFESALEKYKSLLKTQAHIIQRVPVQDIASYLGVSRETLSRIRSKITEE